MDEGIRYLVEEIGKRIDQQNRHIDNRLDEVHSDIKDIKKQSLITNGRVNKLEEKTETLDKLHWNCNALKEIETIKVEVHQIKSDMFIIHLLQSFLKAKWAQRALLIGFILLISGNFIYFVYFLIEKFILKN